MQQEDQATDIGLIRIHDNAIASIAALAALEVEGVKAVEKSSCLCVFRFIGKKDAAAINIEKDKNGSIIVRVPLVVRYGFNIPDVADKVQENIRQALEKMTNVTVRYINISIQAVAKEAK